MKVQQSFLRVEKSYESFTSLIKTAQAGGTFLMERVGRILELTVLARGRPLTLLIEWVRHGGAIAIGD
jgi:hypothetical protein